MSCSKTLTIVNVRETSDCKARTITSFSKCLRCKIQIHTTTATTTTATILGRSGKLWDALERSGKLWEALGSSGKRWEAPGRSGKPSHHVQGLGFCLGFEFSLYSVEASLNILAKRMVLQSQQAKLVPRKRTQSAQPRKQPCEVYHRLQV